MTLGEILGWLVAGLVVGAIARLLVPGRQPIGCLLTAVLGIVGALVGGVLYNLIAHGTFTRAGEFRVDGAWPGWLFSILGAVLVLAIFQAISRRPRRW